MKLILGGGRGIGLAITRAFAEGGATVVITYNSSDPSSTAASVSSEFGVPVHVYHCPGEKSEIVDEVVERVSKEVGDIDIVIANAGVSMWKDSIDMTDCELNHAWCVIADLSMNRRKELDLSGPFTSTLQNVGLEGSCFGSTGPHLA